MPAYKELLHHRLVATSMMYKKITYASAKMLKQKIQEVASKQDLSKTQTLSQAKTLMQKGMTEFRRVLFICSAKMLFIVI